ncbi:MAG: RNA polymerase sigma factor [Myxococcales bacterium]|nr:RNA polymerase sigma factor [Myxococcales bacterium]
MAWSIRLEPETLVLAQKGDADAIEQLADALRIPVYNLAVRVLFEPQEAEDAAQDAVLKVLRGIRGFRHESRFSTWAYRVAVRSLLDARRGRRESLTLEEGTAALDQGLADPGPNPEDPLLVEEVKLACTTALLVCLPRTQRMAYVLGDIVGLSGPEAAAVLDIASTAYRQRLAAARKTIRGFFRSRCGLWDPALPCRCEQQTAFCTRVGFVDPQKLRFADKGQPHQDAMRDLDAAFQDLRIFATHPSYDPPEGLNTTTLRARLEAMTDGAP